MRCATEVKISSLTRFTVASCTRCKVLGKSDELTAAFDLPRDVRSQAKSQRHRSGPELLGEPLLSGIGTFRKLSERQLWGRKRTCEVRAKDGAHPLGVAAQWWLEPTGPRLCEGLVSHAAVDHGRGTATARERG